MPKRWHTTKGNSKVIRRIPNIVSITGGAVTISGISSFTGSVSVINTVSVTGSVEVLNTVAITGSTTILGQGFVSVSNSTTALLGTDGVFTGIGEDVSQYASVSILYKSDVAAAASGLKIEFSQDNTNWDVSLVGDLGAKTFQVHRLVPAANFFRVVYTNGAATQGTMRLQCIFHKSSAPVLITRSGQPQSTVDATPTRQTADIDLDFARKHIPGGRAFFFFGFNDTIGTTYEDVHPNGGDITWLTTASVIEIVSTHADDAAAGLGVQSVEVHGLSALGVDQDEVIATGGLTAVTSSLTYIRVNKMHNEAVGTYGGSHRGKISCSVLSSGSVLSVMTGVEGNEGDNVQYGSGEAGNGYWSVPLGKVMYITRLEVVPVVGTNKTVDVALYEREGILNFDSAPFDPRRVLWAVREIDFPVEKVFKAHLKIKALTDVFFRALGAATPRVEVYLDFYLLDQDASGA